MLTNRLALVHCAPSESTIPNVGCAVIPITPVRVEGNVAVVKLEMAAISFVTVIVRRLVVADEYVPTMSIEPVGPPDTFVTTLAGTPLLPTVTMVVDNVFVPNP